MSMTTYQLYIEATEKAVRTFQRFFQIPQVIEAKGCPIQSYTFVRDEDGHWYAKAVFDATPVEYNNIRSTIAQHHFRSFTEQEYFPALTPSTLSFQGVDTCSMPHVKEPSLQADLATAENLAPILE